MNEPFSTCAFNGFSCVRPSHKELGRRLKKTSPVIAEIFTLMSRDEARHAGFLNKAMSDFDLALDLGFLTKNRQVRDKCSAVQCRAAVSQRLGHQWEFSAAAALAAVVRCVSAVRVTGSPWEEVTGEGGCVWCAIHTSRSSAPRSRAGANTSNHQKGVPNSTALFLDTNTHAR